MVCIKEESLSFEWDEEKNKSNKIKHGISFETAILVFNDEMRIDLYDKEHSVDEDRFVTIGSVGEIIFVVYTMRAETTRIISARIASRTERNVYYGNY